MRGWDEAREVREAWGRYRSSRERDADEIAPEGCWERKGGRSEVRCDFPGGIGCHIEEELARGRETNRSLAALGRRRREVELGKRAGSSRLFGEMLVELG